MLEVKPCPFCGAMPEIDFGPSKAPFPPGEEFLSCPTVLVGIPGVMEQRCGASAIGVQAWNRRVPPTVSEAMGCPEVRELAEAARAFDSALSRYPDPPELVSLADDSTGARLNILHIDAFRDLAAALKPFTQEGEG